MTTTQAAGNTDGSATALHALGVQRIGEHRVAEAVPLLERAVLQSGGAGRPGWWHNLAAAYAIAGRWDLMYATAIRGLVHFPDHAQLSIDAARADVARGLPGDALQRLRELRSTSLEAALVEARALCATRQRQAAIGLLVRCVERYPDSRQAHLLLGTLYREHPADTGRAAEHAEAAALLHRDRFAPEWSEVALAQWDAGNLDRFLDTGKRLIQNGSASRRLHSFWLCGLLHQDGVSGGVIREASEEWAARHASRHPSRVFTPPPGCVIDWNPAKRLRVGYIGSDLCATPSCHFLLHLFRHGNPAHAEHFVYDLSGKCDHASLEVESLASQWRRCSGLSGDAVASLIRNDRLDILIETTSHFGGGRVWLHQDRLAPLVLVLPNYPSTTGMPHFDAILTDRWVCPPGAESQYTEPVVRLDGGYLAYSPPSCAPEVAPLPMLRNGYPTFGLFQRLPKITARSLDLCGFAMQRFPESRLLIHNTSPDLEHPPELERKQSRTRQYLEAALRNRGVAPERLDFAGPASLSRHFELLSRCDVALDTVPYNGQTTSCECLWMGVPVVTLLGEHHVARIGHWLLDRAGYPEWCARDTTEYKQILDGLLSDPARLADIRDSMRGRVAASLLTDGRRVAAGTEKACRELWMELCRNR